MFAVIRAGAHQYRVQEGETLTVDKIQGQDGDRVVFDNVLMLSGQTGLQIGQPFVAGAKVDAVIKMQTRNPKVVIFKYKRRKNYKRKKGHKQPVTVVQINKIHAH